MFHLPLPLHHIFHLRAPAPPPLSKAAPGPATPNATEKARDDLGHLGLCCEHPSLTGPHPEAPGADAEARRDLDFLSLSHDPNSDVEPPDDLSFLGLYHPLPQKPGASPRRPLA